MAPAPTASVASPTSKDATQPRTLLLSPPSLSSHPEKLNQVVEAHDRHVTDIQMLDRLSLSLVLLPPSTYSTIIILTDADNTRTESRKLLTRKVLTSLVTSLKPGGVIRSQDGTFASEAEKAERQEVILAGLLVAEDGVKKPDYDTTAAVPLRFGKNKPAETSSTVQAPNTATSTNGAASTTSPAGTGVVTLNLNGKRSNGPAGVGFVDFSDDFDAPEEEYDDDELIDENTLLEESDFTRPIVQRTRPPPPFKFTISFPPTPQLTSALPQRPNAAPPPASAAAPAKTAPAASPPRSPPKTPSPAKAPIRNSPLSPPHLPLPPRNSQPTTWPRWISPSRARWAVVGTARWEMRSAATGVRTWDCRRLSRGRRSGWRWGTRGRCKGSLGARI
jgi:hypothetical protein